MPKLTRRDFLKVTAVTGAALALPAGEAQADELAPERLKKVGETSSICPYCSVGCGLIIATDANGHLSNVEGDLENPVNRGALCPKAVAARQLTNSPYRLHKVLYRAPGATAWEEKPWDWTINTIAQRVKKTRDETFVRNFKVGDADVSVNRTEGLAWLGGAANNSEDCYAASKLMRSLGVVYLEHQARI